MKIKMTISAAFAAVGACAAAVAIGLSFLNLNSAPVLLSSPAEAQAQVAAVMDAVCEADYEKAGQMLYGSPSLGVDREAADEVGILLWDAFTDSLSYELVGDCYASEDGLSQNVKLTGLDVTTVTANLRERSQKLLEKRVLEADDPDDVYDKNNDYREDFVMDVLYDAAKEALKADGEEVTVEFTLNLTYQDDRWQVIANEALLDAISSGVLY